MKKIIWIIIIIAVAAAGYWFWNSRKQLDRGGLPQLPAVSEEDTTTQIQQDLEQIDPGDIDEQFESIDAELNNL